MKLFKEVEYDADIAKLQELIMFVEEFAELSECPVKVITQLNIAIDEVFSNIANYAYPDTLGKVKITIERLENPNGIKIIFSDNGIQYNPLLNEDPDITQSAEERQPGGLGVFMVKKLMDKVEYVYEDGRNILTIEKMF